MAKDNSFISSGNDSFDSRFDKWTVDGGISSHADGASSIDLGGGKRIIAPPPDAPTFDITQVSNVSDKRKIIPVDEINKRLGLKEKEAPKRDIIPVEEINKNLPDMEKPKEGEHPLAADMHAKNRFLAARQFTTPNTDDHNKNYAGEVHSYYPGEEDQTPSKEPVEFGKNYNSGSTNIIKDINGKWVKFDPEKHVVLFDEKDGKAKAYNRTEETDYGRVVGAGMGLGAILGDSLHMSPITSTIGGGPVLVDKLTKSGAVAKNGKKALFDPSVPPASRVLYAGPEGAKIPLTPGQKVLEETRKIEEATGGARVPDTRVNTFGYRWGPDPNAGVTPGVNVPIPKSQVAGMPGSVAANVASHIPGGHGPVLAGANAEMAAIEKAAEEAAKLPRGHAPSSVEDAGATVRAGIEGYVGTGGRLTKQVEDAYNKVDPLISPTATNPLTHTRLEATKVQAARTAARLADAEGPALGELKTALANPDITYEGLKRLRSEIGAAVGSGSYKDRVLSNADRAEFKLLHGALTDDMRDLIGLSGGKRAITAWEKANKLAGNAADKKEQLITILGADPLKTSDEKIFSRIVTMAGGTSSADVKKLALARKALGAKDWRDVASATISRLGRGKDGSFDFDTFLRDYSKFSDAGKNILFGQNTAHRTALDSIVKLGETWPKTAKLAAPSSELTHLAGFAGAVHHFTEAVAFAIGANKVSKAMSSPVTADSAARWFQTYKVVSLKPTRANAEIFTQATRRLGEDLAKGESSGTVQAARSVAEPAGKFADYILDKTGVKDWWAGRGRAIHPEPGT